MPVREEGNAQKYTGGGNVARRGGDVRT